MIWLNTGSTTTTMRAQTIANNQNRIITRAAMSAAMIALLNPWAMTGALSKPRVNQHQATSPSQPLKQQPPTAQGQDTKAITAQMQAALPLFAKGDYAGAIAAWTQVIMAKPSATTLNQALINRSKAYLILGQASLALADLDSCSYQPAQINELAELWLLKGAAHLQNKQYNDAINAFNQAQRLRPSNAMIYANRSVAYQSLGKLQDAKKDIQQAIKLQATLANYFNLAVLLRLSGNAKSCYALMSQIIDKSQPFAKLYIQRGLCAAELSRNDDAIADMLKALKLEPNNVEAIQQLGLILIKKNDKAAAKQYLLKASSMRLANGDVTEYQKILAIMATLDQR